jgi:hypothetical protein
MTTPTQKDARDMSTVEYRAAVREIVADGHRKRQADRDARAIADANARLKAPAK